MSTTRPEARGTTRAQRQTSWELRRARKYCARCFSEGPCGHALADRVSAPPEVVDAAEAPAAASIEEAVKTYTDTNYDPRFDPEMI